MAMELQGTQHQVQGREGALLCTKLTTTPYRHRKQPLSGLPLLLASRT